MCRTLKKSFGRPIRFSPIICSLSQNKCMNYFVDYVFDFRHQNYTYLINCLKKMLMEHLKDFRPHIIGCQVWNSIQNIHCPCKRPPIPCMNVEGSNNKLFWRDFQSYIISRREMYGKQLLPAAYCKNFYE